MVTIIGIHSRILLTYLLIWENNMNNLEYFKLLPEIMSYEDINEEFLRFIENLYLMNSISENLDILVELSSRQWNIILPEN